MLPMENRDRDGMLLTIGLIPMLIANTSGFLLVMKKAPLVKRLVFFLQSVIEIILVVHYFIYSLS